VPGSGAPLKAPAGHRTEAGAPDRGAIGSGQVDGMATAGPPRTAGQKPNPSILLICPPGEGMPLIPCPATTPTAHKKPSRNQAPLRHESRAHPESAVRREGRVYLANGVSGVAYQ
jgi:hypothetical protein